LPGYREPVPQIPALIGRGMLRVERFRREFTHEVFVDTQ